MTALFLQFLQIYIYIQNILNYNHYKLAYLELKYFKGRESFKTL